MTRSAYTIALTLTAVSLCLSAPASAQLYLENYRSDKPGVELDMDVLNDLPPRAPDAHKPQQADPASAAPPTPAFNAAQNAPAVPAPTVEQAPRKLNKPLFAAPIATPMPPEKPPVQAKPAPIAAAPVAPAEAKSVMPPRIMSMPPKPAARKPYNPYLTAPASPQQAAPVRATPMPPIAAPTPAARQTETAPLRDMPVKSDIDEILRQPPTLPHRKPDVEPVVEATAAPDVAPQKPLPKPPIESLPEEIISEAEIDGVSAAPAAETLAADEKSASVTLPAPKPVFTRPSLIVTDKAPPVMPRAVLKQAEVTMPVSDAEYEQIAENMERVPVQVAIAPPKPVLTSKTVSPADLTLEFDRTSESLNATAQEKLKNIIAHMIADEDTKLQVRAYATGDDGSKSGARSKSLTRATEVRSFLMDNGIKPTRVIVRALGHETDRKPLDRIDLTFTK